MNFLIRDAKSEDARAIGDFQIAMARETEHRDLQPSLVRPGVQSVLDDPANGFYLVACSEGEVIASLLVTFEWSDWRNGVFWWIQSVYVLPQRRGHGIFRALYAHVKTRAEQQTGVCGLRLYVERDNWKAQAVYEKLGMSQTPYRVYEEEF